MLFIAYAIIEHITRELFELIGERAPPVAAQEVQYKVKPKLPRKLRPWSASFADGRAQILIHCYRELSPFTNPSRDDGLVLRHWRKKKEPHGITPGPATPADTEMGGVVKNEPESKPTVADNFARFNIKISGPEYTEEEYDAHLRSDGWTKEETDYLVNLVMDFDLRWIVIGDRYDYHPHEPDPEGDAMAISTAVQPRTMEDMKARYYDVAANMMALHHPLASMSTSEFDLHEKMTKYNSVQETTRKKLAEALLSRSPEDIREEEILLGELKRIVTNEERLAQERKELYARLEAPQSTGNTAIYQTSQGLAQLMATLLSADKNKKRRSLMGPNDGASSPAAGPSNQQANQVDRSQRPSLPGGNLQNKKSSMSLGQNQRQLTPREEAKYGVTHHDRLTSGVSFRTARIDKLIAAKSTAQSAKITAALTELVIPPKLVMPTAKVCAEFERLVGGIQTLLDVRKVSEKVESEIRVLKAQQEERERRDRGEVGGSDGVAQEDREEGDEEEEARDEEEEDEDAEVARGSDEDEENDGEGEEDVDRDGDGNGDGDGDGGEEEEGEGNEDEGEGEGEGQESRGSVAPSVKSNAVKRSASVFSEGSQKSTKRQRK